LVLLNGDILGDSAHGGTPPPLPGGKTLANAIYSRLQSNQREDKGMKKQQYK